MITYEIAVKLYEERRRFIIAWRDIYKVKAGLSKAIDIRVTSIGKETLLIKAHII